MAIPIIDLFAGPGGLGEGFASILDENRNRVFRIALSIEKDEFAHKTLTLRAFTRQFPINRLPAEYYLYLKGEINLEELYEKYPVEAGNAKVEAWKFEVGDKANHRIIDKRIKDGLKGEKNFILIGGPPCQAYSLVGRSRRQEKEGLDENDPRVYLYREYYRILAVHSPQVFVMENVKGILSSKVKNKKELVFNQIVSDLKNPFKAYIKLQGKEELQYTKHGYKIYSLVTPVRYDIHGQELFDPREFIIKTEEYGVPQTRHRVILLGIRNDMEVLPAILQKSDRQIGIKNVIAGLPRLRSGLSKQKDTKEEWNLVLENSVADGVWENVDEDIKKRILQALVGMSQSEEGRGGLYIPAQPGKVTNSSWYIDKNLGGICNHETRSHIKEDLHRYLFAACFAERRNRSPKLSDFPIDLLPKHLNIDKGITENKFADRFRVQLYEAPSKTITSHISKDGHYYIHPDPSQCRSFTVREAARIQTFPDNYFFCGPRTQQFHQVGNAVPPLLAKQIAKIVKEVMVHRSIC